MMADGVGGGIHSSMKLPNCGVYKPLGHCWKLLNISKQEQLLSKN